MNEISIGRLRELVSEEQFLRVRYIVMDLIRNGIRKEGPVSGQPEPRGVSDEGNKAWDDNRIVVEKEVQVNINLREIRNSKLEVDALLRASQDDRMTGCRSSYQRDSCSAEGTWSRWPD